MTTKVAVIGMGYVGIPAAALLADVDGFDVVGVQRRSKRSGWKIDLLNEGGNPIGGNEPGLEELLKRVVLEKKSFRVTDDITVCKTMDFILIDVQTPTDADHIPRYESLRDVTAQIAKVMPKGVTVIIESTCAPGTTDFIVKPILEENSGMKAGSDFHLIFSYERVMVGRLIHNIVNLPRIVGGIDDASTEKGLWLYKHIVKQPLHPTTALTAEVAKTVENTYRDVNIAFANEVALISESLGVDVYKVRELVNTLPNDPSNPATNPVRNMHFPGAGVGGHCLPKDPWLLKYGMDEYGKFKFEPKVIVNSRHINDRMPIHTVEVLESLMKAKDVSMQGAKIAVLGAAFLENSDDTRNSPTVPIVKALQERGAMAAVHDPLVRQEEFEYPLTKDLDEVLEGAAAMILMVKHDEYRGMDPDMLKERMASLVVVDGRNFLDADALKGKGFAVRVIGKGEC